MKTTIRDANILRSIQPNQVIAYLQRNGWTQESNIPDKASIWVWGDETEDENTPEILLPIDSSFRDFPIRMGEILKTLSEVEGRSQVEIFETLTSVLSDILEVRLNHRDFEDGTIPLNNGVSLLRHTKDMILSAASSAVEAKKHFEQKKPIQANHYLKEVRFGQTKRGSFIITIISPLGGTQTSLFSEYVPFERSVIRKLIQALENVKSLAEDIKPHQLNFEVSEASVEQGVSANLCEALVGIHKSGKEKGFEVKFDLASGIDNSQDIKTKIELHPDIMYTIARIGKRLKAEIYPDFSVIEGEVTRLERQRDDETGLITLVAPVENQKRKIKVELSEFDYNLASQANKERKLITCQGDLAREGRVFTLLNPRKFTLV